MSNYDNTNRGSIWKNDKKQTDSHPDFTGSLNVNGVEYWVTSRYLTTTKPAGGAVSLSPCGSGSAVENGYSNVSRHGSATHFMPLPTPPRGK